MSMTPSQLSIIVKSQGIKDATVDLNNLAKASASVDAETKAFVIAQQKLAASNKNSSTSSQAAARGVTVQELAMIKAHDAALRMNSSIDRQIAAQERMVRGVSQQELSMIKAHEQALKMNTAFDKQAESLKNANHHGSIFNNTLKSMATAALAYMGVNFAAGVIKQADAWAMMQSKLALATGSMDSAKVAQKDLYDLAQKLRIPLDESAKLFTRMAHPMMMMGKTTKDTMQMVEALGTALKLSGATGQEASSAMLQFSQSMNAGRLNGGEFNSIAEASPNILRAIEAELRRTGQWADNTTETLKKMGSEGKISSELLARSLQNALPQMRKDFETLPLTFDGAMERLKNSWLKAVGEMGQNTKFTQELAKSLAALEESLPRIANTLGTVFNFLAQNLGTIATVIGGLVGAGLVSWAYSSREALMGMVTVMRTLTASALAFMATPVGMAIAAVTLAVGAGVYAYDKYTEAQEASKKAAEDLGKISPDIVKSMDAEYEAALKQYKVLFKIKEIKDELKSQGEVSSIDKANAEVLELVAKAQAAIKRGDKENSDMYQEKLKIAALELGRLKTKDDEIKALQRVNGLEAERQANAKRVQTLFDKYADNSDKREKELAQLKDLVLTEKERSELISKINLKYADKASVDKYKTLRESTIAYSNTLEELKQRYSELQKFGVDDKRTASEKELTKVQLELSQATDKVVKAEKEKQLVIAKGKVVLEDLILAETKRQKEAQLTLDTYTKDADAVEKSAEQQEMLLLAYGKTEGELQNLRMIKEENKLLDMAQRGVNDDLLAQQQRIVDGLVRESKARNEIGFRKDSKELADKYEADYQAANKKIADGLYNAIGKGGESAIKKLIQDIKSWFARLVLSPIINPISNFGASIMSPNAASAGGVGQSLAQGGDMVSNLSSTLSSAYSAFTGGLATAFTSFATTSTGAMLGLSKMATVSSGLVSSSAPVLTSLGSALSTVATIAPYLAAAAVLYKGLQMGEKEKTGTTITGNLGTDNLMRNQSWTQSGGFLRSDRSGTWSYGLKDSTAMQDGKAYTDPANMAGDKALLTQLNSMYDAVKASTTEYANALGLDAKSIKDRADNINFAFGKSADETASNINKAFEDVTNNIASSLLGELSKLALVNESASSTMMRLAKDITSVNGMFKALNYSLFDVNVSGIKSAEALITLFGGLDKFQAIASDYYDKFYSESEKTKSKVDAMTKSLGDLGIQIPSSRAAFRELVEAAQKAGNNELYVSLMKLSGAFADITEASTEAAKGAKELPQAVRDTFEALSKDAERWLSIRNQAASLKDEISVAMGNPQKDPAVRMKQLWDAMSKDVTPEQKLQLAGELKDLMLQKYQVEKESLTKLIDFGKQLRGYVDSLKVGALSPLTMGQKLAEAQAQYQTTFSKAQGGDTAAQGMLQGKADTYLQLAQTALASSSEYSTIFSEVTNGLDSLGIESMSAAERASQTATEQLAELQRLSDFVGSVEVTANSYYNNSLTALGNQITLMDAMYQKMGIFDGMLSSLAGLPAEIAAALSGKAGSSFGNDEFIRNLYQSVEGRTGSQVDSAGYNYWMQDLMTSTKEKVATNFVLASQQNSMNKSSSTVVLETQIAALTAEVKGLREDQNAQTGAMIDAQVMTSETSTAAIVSATKETVKDESWQSSLKPELI
jgi:tape measure domain-containing protein